MGKLIHAKGNEYFRKVSNLIYVSSALFAHKTKKMKIQIKLEHFLIGTAAIIAIFYVTAIGSPFLLAKNNSEGTTVDTILTVQNGQVAGVDMTALSPTPYISCPSGQTAFYDKCVSTLMLFGQRSFKETAHNKPTAGSLYHASGVAVDYTSTPPKIYVVDSGNNRVLGFNGFSSSATLVFGQPDFEGSSCNGDNNIGMFQPPNASTLCLTQYPVGTNVAEQWMHTNLEVDNVGNLYVVDVSNNRVVKYNQPFSGDKTNGKGDTIADFVIGQDNFSTNGVNKGAGEYAPTASSLWVSFGRPDHVAARGVSADSNENVWIADTFNNRVLRFPKGSNKADLVLGRGLANFNTNGTEACGDVNGTTNQIFAPLNKMCSPTLARVSPETGELYVIDEYPPGFRARILVFKPPFTSGMSAYNVLKPEIPNYYFNISTIAFNQFKQGSCAAGDIWVNEHTNHGGARTLLLDKDGTIITSIAEEVDWPSGSLGFDTSDNIYIADEGRMKVLRYTLRTNLSTNSCFAERTGEILGPNSDAPGNLSEAVGMIPAGDQLIVKSYQQSLGRYGLKVWQNYTAKQRFGSLSDFTIPFGGGREVYAIDDDSRLWTTNQHGKLSVFKIPLTSTSSPIAENLKLYWSDDGQEVQYSMWESGPAFDVVNKSLWVPDTAGHRILRVRNHASVLSGRKLIVDMVIGQPDKASVKCNNNQEYGWTASGPPTASSLCGPSRIRFDHFANLYVVENSYECHGNNRMTVFMNTDIQNTRTLFPNIAAKKVFVRGSFTEKVSCDITANNLSRPVLIAFNSKNEMVVGTDGYSYDNKRRHLLQLYYYKNPLGRWNDGRYVLGQPPDASIELPMGAPGEIWFDKNDNLIVQDHTWPRVWVIDIKEKDEKGNYVWLSPLPNDSDSDGLYNFSDNCPFVSNQLQQDSDSNGIGDACDDMSMSIIVLSPNGGETLMRGTNTQIQWSAPNVITGSKSLADIYLALYYPPCTEDMCPKYPYQVPYIIAKNVPSGGGRKNTYDWTVGKVMDADMAKDGSYTIQVCQSGTKEICDQSDSYFEIVSSGVPVISGVSGPQSLAVGQTGTWSVKASDPSGGVLTYSVLWGDEIAAPLDASRQRITPPQQTATFTHAYRDAGNYTPTFIVTNQSGASAQASLSVVVGGGAIINTPPKITGITAPTSLQVGETSQFGFAAVDPDRDDLAWAVSWGETGISSAIACPVFPQAGEGKGRGYTTQHAWNTPGTYRVSVYVTDCHGGEDHDAFTVVVGESGRRVIIWQGLAWTPIDVGATAPDDGTWYTFGNELRQDGVTDRHYKVVAVDMKPMSDYEVKTVVRLQGGSEVGLCGRMDDFGNGYCYAIGGSRQDTIIAVFQGNDQNPEVAAVSKDFTFDQNAEYILRIRLAGQRVQGKVYRLGQPEPAEWAIDFEDSRFKSGKVGLYSYGSRPIFTYLALGTMSGPPVTLPPMPTPVPSPRDESVEHIERRASLLYDDRLSAILSELKLLRNLVQEQQTEIKYLKSLTMDLSLRSTQAEAAIKNFITYGVDDNTKKLGAGERAAVMHSYKSAFDKLPETEAELTDAIKIANGRWPSEESAKAEARAKTEFKKIYLREPNLQTSNDDAAVTIMAYGLRQRAENRNLRSEAQGIITFKRLYGRTPQSTEDWNIVQAITYSGAKR